MVFGNNEERMKQVVKIRNEDDVEKIKEDKNIIKEEISRLVSYHLAIVCRGRS